MSKKKRKRKTLLQKKKNQACKVTTVTASECEFTIAKACAAVPKSIYQDSLEVAVGSVLNAARWKAHVMLETGVNKASQDIFARIQPRLLGLAEQAEANAAKNLMEVLPEGCRFHWENDCQSSYVIEQKPQVRCLYFTDVIAKHELGGVFADKEKGNRYKVAMPYVVFVMMFSSRRFREMMVYYRTRPLMKLDDELFFANLPNQHVGGEICFGHNTGFFNSGDPPAKQVADVLRFFWASMFNTDLSDKYFIASCNDPRLKDLQTWVSSSESDPMFVLNVKWQSFCTLGARINSLFHNTNSTLLGLRGMFTNVTTELEMVFLRVLETIKSNLVYDGEVAQSAFRDSLHQAVFEASKTTIAEYKHKMEVILRKSEADRLTYLKLVNRDKTIKKPEVAEQLCAGGTW